MEEAEKGKFGNLSALERTEREEIKSRAIPKIGNRKQTDSFTKKIEKIGTNCRT